MKQTKRSSNRNQTTYNSEYKGHPINTCEGRQLGCYTEILEKIKLHMDSMLARHNKVFTVRFDIRYPQGYTAHTGNRDISTFMSRFYKRLKRCGYAPRYIWVREQNSSENQHFHCLLFLNGNKVQRYINLLRWAEELWQRILDIDNGNGLIDRCNRCGQNGIMLRRNAADFINQYDSVYLQASYLAKISSKDKTPHGTRLYGASELPVNEGGNGSE